MRVSGGFVLTALCKKRWEKKGRWPLWRSGKLSNCTSSHFFHSKTAFFNATNEQIYHTNQLSKTTRILLKTVGGFTKKAKMEHLFSMSSPIASVASNLPETIP